MKKTYCGEADFWKLMFSLVILLFHGTEGFAGAGDPQIFPAGALGVDFFLLVSGYLMMCSAERARKTCENTPEHSISRETASFLGRKLSTVGPAYGLSAVVSMVSWLVASMGIRHLSLGNLLEKGSMTLWNLLLLNGSGIRYVSVNGSVWYISSMLFAMLLLYPICRRFREFYRCILVPGLVFCLLGYLSQVNGGLRGPGNYLPIGLTAGTCRAILEIALGSVVYDLVGLLKSKNLTALSRWLLAGLELVCFAGVLGLIQVGCWGNGQLDFVALLLLFVAVTVVFSGQSALATVFSSPIWRICGTYSLHLYLCQIPVRSLLTACNDRWSWPYERLMATFLAGSLILAAVLMWLEPIMKRFWKNNGLRISGWFVR